MTPLLARVYPNGKADVNHFHAAGGMPFLIRELLDAGLLHEDVSTVWGQGLRGYVAEPGLAADGGAGMACAAPKTAATPASCAASASRSRPPAACACWHGDLGRAVMKTSAVAAERHVIEAPARVFHSQEELQAAFKAASSIAISSPWCASRGRRPTACRNCTS